MAERIDIPVCEKYILSLNEAAEYFRIGVNQLRKLAKVHKDDDWVLWNGTHVQIKRTKFEKFLDTVNAL